MTFLAALSGCRIQLMNIRAVPGELALLGIAMVSLPTGGSANSTWTWISRLTISPGR